MKFVFSSGEKFLCSLLLCSLLIVSTMATIPWLIKKLDDSWKLYLSRKEKRYLPLLVLLNGTVIAGLNRNSMENLLLSVFAGCLLFACITDVHFYQVYQITWWIGGAAGVGLLFLQMYSTFGQEYLNFTRIYLHTEVADWGKCLLSLVLYGVLQEYFFCKMYGRADCHGFLVCAVVECALGGTLKTYLFQMLLAIAFLTLVQLFHKNINRKGNLITPVPFLPYITLSFWVVICH